MSDLSDPKYHLPEPANVVLVSHKGKTMAVDGTALAAAPDTEAFLDAEAEKWAKAFGLWKAPQGET